VNCPACESPSHVLESRRADDGASVRRRRECDSCGRRFTTYERREREPLLVTKRDGERQRFDRTKLRAALLRAAHKRPVEAHDVEVIVEQIEREIEASGGGLSSARVSELCLAGLRELDYGAYLQYAGTLPALNAEIASDGAPDPPEGSVRPESDHPVLPAETG
jgi:transcriptional repressor NrdR